MAVNGSNNLDSFKNVKIIPEVIDVLPGAGIKVEYNSGVQAHYGNELKPAQVKDQPKFIYEAKQDELYTMVMVDPDAPSRKEPKFREILHFMVANIPGTDVSKGDVLAEYIGSGPPQGTGLHRYIFLLYKQKGRLTSGMKIPKTSRNGRTSFSIRNFAKEHELGEPIAGNFYLAQYDDYVPQLHAQLSQG